MIRLFFTFCVIALTLSVVNAQSARADLIKALLDVPAPAPIRGLPNISVESESYGPVPPEIPPDDAPIEELIRYWVRVARVAARLRYWPRPTARVVERLLDYSAEFPETTRFFLPVMPAEKDVVGRVKRIREEMGRREDLSTNDVDEWLTMNSDFAIDKLVEASQKVVDKDEYVTNQDELLALAAIDWNRAAPIVERLIDDTRQPVSSTLAKWVSYAHAIRENDELDISKFRRQLQDIVEDRNQPPGARDLALDALSSEAEWDGREDWYATLFEDETLADLRVNGRSMTGLRTLVMLSPPGKYTKLMIRLAESRKPVVRRIAVTNLGVMVTSGDLSAIRALLPWLSDPNWVDAPAGIRLALIRALKDVDIPESVPGLIHLISTEENFKSETAATLGKYRDSRAAPILRKVATETLDAYPRSTIIAALDACGGLTDEEKLAALEYLASIRLAVGPEEFSGLRYRPAAPGPQGFMVSVGFFVVDSREPSDGFVNRVIARLKTLRRTQPPIAALIAEVLTTWRGPAVYAEDLRRIRAGEATLDDVVRVLARSGEIREKNMADVSALAATNGLGRGIAACLTASEADLVGVLREPDNIAKASMLACARLQRLPLPVAETAELMGDKDPLLALAADRFIESEDSVEARTLYLARHAGEARILGARTSFIPFDVEDRKFKPGPNASGKPDVPQPAGRSFDQIQMVKFERSLRDELLANPDLTAVYASIWDLSAGHNVIRVFKDRIVYTNYDDAARFSERELSSAEFEEFQRFVIDTKVDEAVPAFRYCGECVTLEFVMFTKNGGRRFFTTIVDPDKLHEKLLAAFGRLLNDKMKLHYRLADRIAGLEVLFADDNLHARAVWKNGPDIRVLIEDEKRGEELARGVEDEIDAEIASGVRSSDDSYEERRRRRDAIEFANFDWRKYDGGQFSGTAPAPPGSSHTLDQGYNYGDLDLMKVTDTVRVRSGDNLILIRRFYEDDAGIYSVSRGPAPSLVRAGGYLDLAVSADGAWAVASKKVTEGGASVVRINLATRRETAVVFPVGGKAQPVVAIPGTNKILVTRSLREVGLSEAIADGAVKTKPGEAPSKPEFYVVDAATGAVQQVVKGDFRPLLQQSVRPLQPTGVANEFWAAIHDEKSNETAVGRYDAAKFEFRPLVRLPEIVLSSMDVWVDEKESKIYFTYEGHLLRVPLAEAKR